MAWLFFIFKIILMAAIKNMGLRAAPSRFLESGNGFNGDRGQSGSPSSMVSKGVERCINNIKQIAKKDAKTPEQVASDILSQSDNELTAYIVSKKAIPKKTVKRRAVQAAMLRMTDIATVAMAGLISDDQATAHVQEGESEAIEKNHPDRSSLLPCDVQAALQIIANRIIKDTDAKDTVDAVNKMTKAVAFGNNFNNGGLTDKLLPDNFDISDLFPDTITTGPSTGAIIATPAQTAGPSDTTDDGESITDIISAIVGGVGSVSGIVKGTATSLQGTGSNIGAESIQKYISTYGFAIAIIIIVIVLLIIITARATN